MPDLKVSKSQYISRVYKNVPKELKQQNNWVVYENKIPFNPATKYAAKSNDETTWGSFSSAINTYISNGYSGVGYCFKPPYIGVDIDKSLDLTIPRSLQSYTEYSPSGTGLHILCKGTIPKAIKTAGLEVYTTHRFFTVTGRRIDEFPPDIRDCTEALKSFYSEEPSGQEKKNEQGWIAQALESLEAGNIHNTTLKIVGKMRRNGWSIDDIRVTLLPHIQRVGGDIRAFEQRLTSAEQYKPEGTVYGRQDTETSKRPVEIFTPETSLEGYDKRIKKRGQRNDAPLPTGYARLDKLTNGLTAGSIWVVGARTGIGKTSFSINIAESLLKVGKRVLFFSTEMDTDAIFDRFLSLRLGIDLFSFGSKGWSSKEDEERYRDIRGNLEHSPLFICPEPEPTLGEVSEAISRIRPDVFIFDHVQRIANSTDKRYLEISKFVKGLNTLCRRNNVAGLVNSQLNRLAELDVPGLHHLKECGSLEEEAHAVLLLSRIKGSDGEFILVDVAKNRGPKGQIEMRFDKKTCQFMEV